MNNDQSVYSYLARQVIVDVEQNTIGYELLFREGEKNCFPDIDPDEATSKLLAESHLTIGVEQITGGYQAFINFHQDTLLHRFPTSLDPKKVVIEIIETVDINDTLVKACAHIKQRGYTLALDDYDFDEKWQRLLPYVSIVKVDISEFSPDFIAQHMSNLKALNVRLVAERVETQQQFECFKQMGFDFFQGYFFAKPEVLKNKDISSSKMTLLELMSASSQAIFNVEQVSDILSKDVGLSFKLLRFINNPAFNKRNKILSLSHALNYMGELEVKKFIALLVLANVASGKPSELTTMSLSRAKFCELLGEARLDASNPPAGFLIGLFSLLDTLLEQDMRQLMAKLPLDDNLGGALCGKTSMLRNYLLLVCAFELGDWPVISSLSTQLNLEQDRAFAFYNQAIHWATQMQAMIEQD